MKWILMIFMNLMVFSAFAQECSWDGMGDVHREEAKILLIQRAKEKIDSYLINKGIVRTSEEQMTAEIITNPDWGQNVAGIRFHYKFKTQKGSEISTDPKDQNGQSEKNKFYFLRFSLNVERDAEGYPLKKLCYFFFMSFDLPLFNLTLNDYFLDRLNIFNYDDHLQIELPLPSKLESE